MALAPLDLVDFLFDLEGFEVVEFRLVGLEFRVEFVFAGFFLLYVSVRLSVGGSAKANCLVALEEDDPSALVTGCEVVAGVVELDRGDDVGRSEERRVGKECPV